MEYPGYVIEGMSGMSGEYLLCLLNGSTVNEILWVEVLFIWKRTVLC